MYQIKVVCLADHSIFQDSTTATNQQPIIENVPVWPQYCRGLQTTDVQFSVMSI